MPDNNVKFVENSNNVANIGDKTYIITYKNPMRFFSQQPLEECSIEVDSKIYPLEYQGWRLCTDLKYRERLNFPGFSGPYSNFCPVSRGHQEHLSASSSISPVSL